MAGPGLGGALEGLPPLPRGLAGILHSSGGSWREIQRVHSQRARIQDDLRRDQKEAAAPPPSHHHRRSSSKRASLDSALAVLRKEMVCLRQLDVSLLCQLWSLRESLQECRGLFQELLSSSASFSLPSDGSLAAENGFSDQETEDEADDEDAPETPLPLAQPQNPRDQWLEESFHIAI